MSVDRARLAAALRAQARTPFELAGARRAAVLVPLVERDGATRVVLTLRAAALRTHGGQWSFPGGTYQDDDDHAVGVAIREAWEEIGLEPAAVSVLGELGDVPTSSSYVITPVVAAIAPAPAAYRPNPGEVDEVLEAPIAALGAPKVIGHVERGGRRIPVLSFAIGGRNVWGVTARILAELLEVIQNG